MVGLDVPYNFPRLDSSDTRTSPFTIVFQKAGAKAAGSVTNAVVLTSVLSAGNHALFAGSRLLYSMGVAGHAPQSFGRLSKRQVPWVAVLGTGFVAAFVLLPVLWAQASYGRGSRSKQYRGP